MAPVRSGVICTAAFAGENTADYFFGQFFVISFNRSERLELVGTGGRAVAFCLKSSNNVGRDGGGG